MIDLVPIFFVLGMVLTLLSGGLAVKCYFYLTGDGVKSLRQENRPNVNKLMKSYRKGDQQVEDSKLRTYYDWIFYTKRAAILSFIVALLLYVGAFAL